MSNDNETRYLGPVAGDGNNEHSGYTQEFRDERPHPKQYFPEPGQYQQQYDNYQPEPANYSEDGDRGALTVATVMSVLFALATVAALTFFFLWRSAEDKPAPPPPPPTTVTTTQSTTVTTTATTTKVPSTAVKPPQLPTKVPNVPSVPNAPQVPAPDDLGNALNDLLNNLQSQ